MLAATSCWAATARLAKAFVVEDTFHLGTYDVLTRILYPLIVGEKVERNSVFHEKASALARAINPDAFGRFSRIQGLLLRRKSD